MPSNNAPRKDKWICRIVDSPAVKLDPGRALLFQETRPSPREHHPATMLRFASTRGGGGVLEVFVLRTMIDLQRSVQTTFVHRLDGGNEAGVTARALLRELTEDELWLVLCNLCCGSPRFAMEALLVVANHRKLKVTRDYEGGEP